MSGTVSDDWRLSLLKMCNHHQTAAVCVWHVPPHSLSIKLIFYYWWCRTFTSYKIWVVGLGERCLIYWFILIFSLWRWPVKFTPKRRRSLNKHIELISIFKTCINRNISNYHSPAPRCFTIIPPLLQVEHNANKYMFIQHVGVTHCCKWNLLLIWNDIHKTNIKQHQVEEIKASV